MTLGATTSKRRARLRKSTYGCGWSEGRARQTAPGEEGIGRSDADSGSAWRRPRAKSPSLEPPASRPSAVPPSANLKAADPLALRHRLTPAMPLSRSLCGVLYRQICVSVQGGSCDSCDTGHAGGAGTALRKPPQRRADLDTAPAEPPATLVRRDPLSLRSLTTRGGVAEWSNAPVLKTGDRSRGPRVRIPSPPPLSPY